MRQLERAGVSVGEITHVVISHQHGDHSLGYPMLMLNRVLFWPERPLVVLGTRHVLEVLHKLVSMVYPDLSSHVANLAHLSTLESAPQPYHPLPCAKGITYAIAPGRHSVHTVGIRLNLPSGRSMVYSADTSPSPAMVEMAQKADLLVHECFFLDSTRPQEERSHSTAAEVGQGAAQAQVGRLALIHREDTDPTAGPAYAAAAAKYYSGPILTPNAGDRVVL
jgi:ribonuclease BN (tRNA processing enzyme)